MSTARNLPKSLSGQDVPRVLESWPEPLPDRVRALSKALAGHYAKAGSAPGKALLEFRVVGKEGEAEMRLTRIGDTDWPAGGAVDPV